MNVEPAQQYSLLDTSTRLGDQHPQILVILSLGCNPHKQMEVWKLRERVDLIQV